MIEIRVYGERRKRKEREKNRSLKGDKAVAGWVWRRVCALVMPPHKASFLAPVNRHFNENVARALKSFCKAMAFEEYFRMASSASGIGESVWEGKRATLTVRRRTEDESCPCGVRRSRHVGVCSLDIFLLIYVPSLDCHTERRTGTVDSGCEQCTAAAPAACQCSRRARVV